MKWAILPLPPSRLDQLLGAEIGRIAGIGAEAEAGVGRLLQAAGQCDHRGALAHQLADGAVGADRVAREHQEGVVALGQQALEQLVLLAQLPLRRHPVVGGGELEVARGVLAGLLPGGEVRVRAAGHQRHARGVLGHGARLRAWRRPCTGGQRLHRLTSDRHVSSPGSVVLGWPPRLGRIAPSCLHGDGRRLGYKYTGSKRPNSMAIAAPRQPEADDAPLAFEIGIDRRSNVAEQIYTALRDAIVSVRLPPGASISENRICRHAGVSRTPVRAAIIRLVDEELIDVFPQQGSFVAPIKLAKVYEGHFIRKALELAILDARGAASGTRRLRRRLMPSSASQQRLVGSEDLAEFYKQESCSTNGSPASPGSAGSGARSRAPRRISIGSIGWRSQSAAG